MSVNPHPPNKKTLKWVWIPTLPTKKQTKQTKQKKSKKIQTFLHKNIWFIKVCWPVSQTWIYFYLHVSTFIGLLFYSQICLWLKTTWKMFKSWTINMFKIDKKRNSWRTIFKRNFLIHSLFFNKVKLILHQQIKQFNS